MLMALVLLPAGALAQRPYSVPEPFAVKGVQLSTEKDAPKHVILLRDGRIEKVLPSDGVIPDLYRVLDGEGLICMPPFIDAYSHAGLAMPEIEATQDAPLDTREDVRIDMRMAGRKGLAPRRSAADFWSMDKKASEAHLKKGFAGVLSAPNGELLAGMSCVALMNGAPKRQAILAADVFGHGAFRASGRGYPGTLMGYHAVLRQFWMDAGWQAELQGRRDQGLAAPAWAFDRDLEAAQEYLSGKRVLVCEADRAERIERWIGLADQFSLKIAISGGKEAWRVADELARRKIPVILTLNWDEEVKDPEAKDKEPKDEDRKEAEPEAAGEEAPKDEDALEEEITETDTEEQDEDEVEPDGDQEGHDGEHEEDHDEEHEEDHDESDHGDKDKWTYQEPLALRKERRARWEQQRDNALRLQEAGVTLYFGSGSENSAKMLKRLGVLVDAGFPREELIQILSVRSADWLGVRNDLGPVAEGQPASFVLWDGDPFAKKSKVQSAFLRGHWIELDKEGPKKRSAQEEEDRRRKGGHSHDGHGYEDPK